MSDRLRRRAFLRGASVLGLGAVGAGVIDAGTAWAETSQNGWPAARDLNRNRDFNVGGVRFPDGVAWGAPETILGYVARQYVATVEPLETPGCWGFNYRTIGGGTTLSNHASGTALDFNAPRHPQGSRGTFTSGQVAAIRTILAYCDGVVRWGGDYTGAATDEMHFELHRPPGDPAVDALVAKINGSRSRRYEVGIWRPGEGRFHLRDHNGKLFYVSWGENGDLPVTGDWNGDGRFEVGIWRPREGRFHLRDHNGKLFYVDWGENGDVPVTGDWNGDGRFEVGIWRPREGRFHLRDHNGKLFYVDWGENGDLPVTGDWNGDGRFEVGIWRPGEGRFHLRDHNGKLFYVPWGAAGDIPVTGDWNGDGRFEVGIWRPGEGRFHLRDHNGKLFYVDWGENGDRPVTADWNG